MDWRFAVQICAWIVGIPLQLMVIAAMWRGVYRQYLILFVYSIVAFLIAVAEIPLFLAEYAGQADAIHELSKWYWADDVILEGLLYTIVFALIYKATEGMKPRALIRAVLTAGGLAFAGLSFLIHYSPSLPRGEYMIPWTRDLSVCSTILDLALWMVLLSSREKDSRLLLISGGLGIQFAGSAIGDAVQELANQAHHSHRFSDYALILSRSGAVFSTLTGFACLYIWWHAFRPAREAARPSQALLEGATQRKS